MDPNQDQNSPTPEQEAASQLKKYTTLLEEVQAREKVFKEGWWKQADSAVRMYDCGGDSKDDDTKDSPYNILYSNTEVLLPSLYSSTPKPDIRARFKDLQIKPIPEVIERYLTIVSDPSNPGVESLDQAMVQAVLCSLTAGMGYVRLRYYENRPVPVAFEAGHYKSLIWGLARKWAKVPWIAFKHDLTREEFYSQFDIAEDEQVNLRPLDQDHSDSDDKPNGVEVYEVWNKKDKTVYFLCADWNKVCVEKSEDKLKLEGFFPLPGPLLMTDKPGKLTPIPLYQYYKNQADELNRVTVRLNKILSAIRVRGAYNSLLGSDLQKILSDDDLENALVPASENGMMAAQNGGFDRHIWMLPIDKLILVATQLYQARQQIKQVIYELTGISDIIRGSSVASETATAQDLKNKWGTIRLRKMQTLVANYVRDLFRLATDCGAKSMPPEKWLQMVQMQIPSQQQKMQAKQQVMQLAQQQQMAAQQAQLSGQPAPQPQQPPPDLIKTLQSPSIEEIIKKIADDANRTFTVNVQTSSTIDLDTAADKADVGEFMNSMGQLMAGIQPLVQLGPSGLEAAKAILTSVCKRYKFGLEIVDSLQNLEMPPPAQEGEGEKIKAQSELQVIQAESQAKLQEIQGKLQLMQQELKIKQQELQLKEEELQLKRKQMQAQFQMQLAQAALTQQTQGARVPGQAKPQPKAR